MAVTPRGAQQEGICEIPDPKPALNPCGKEFCAGFALEPRLLFLAGWQGAAAAAAGTELVREICVFETFRDGLARRDLKNQPVPTSLALGSPEHSLLMPEGWDKLALPSCLRYRATKTSRSSGFGVWVCPGHIRTRGAAAPTCSDHK